MFAEMRHALDRGRPGADDRDAFVAKLVQVAGRIAAGIVVVPPAGVEAVPLVAVDAGNTGQLWPVERAVRPDDVARLDVVVTACCDQPPVLALEPLQFADLGLEAGVAVEIEGPADALGVLADLRREGVFSFGM
jgi:hypothetical protein